MTGFEFDTTACDTGAFGVYGGCDLVKDDTGNYVTVIEPLAPGDLITVGGTITGFDEPSLPPIPEPPPPVPTGFSTLGLLMIPVGVAGGALAFLWNRRRGSNEVAGAGGAADAAFGGLPAPGTSAAALAGAPTRRVTDAQLAAMATIEFVPPRGLEPWMGQALLHELVDQDTVVAWFSELIAQEAMVITTDGDDHALAPGPQRDRVSAADQMHIAQLFRKESSIELGTYDATFAGTWKRVSGGATGLHPRLRLVEFDDREGEQHRCRLPRCADRDRRAVRGQHHQLRRPGRGTAHVAVAGDRARDRPARSSSVCSPTRRWCRRARPPDRRSRCGPNRSAASWPRAKASTSQWAWDNGLLREYSAWAVALDAADAWERAIRASNIPEPQAALGGPLLVHSLAYSMAGMTTPPQSSSGSSGGFSGGGGGGGGGGGSSGSW